MNDLDKKKKELQSEVDSLQSNLDARINSIKKQITDTLSVQEWVRKYPLESVGIATLVGLILALNTSGKKQDKVKESSDVSLKGMLISEVKKQLLSKLIQKVAERINLAE